MGIAQLDLAQLFTDVSVKFFENRTLFDLNIVKPQYSQLQGAASCMRNQSWNDAYFQPTYPTATADVIAQYWYIRFLVGIDAVFRGVGTVISTSNHPLGSVKRFNDQAVSMGLHWLGVKDVAMIMSSKAYAWHTQHHILGFAPFGNITTHTVPFVFGQRTMVDDYYNDKQEVVMVADGGISISWHVPTHPFQHLRFANGAPDELMSRIHIDIKPSGFKWNGPANPSNDDLANRSYWLPDPTESPGVVVLKP